MAGIRKNIMASTTARDKYVQALVALDQPRVDVTVQLLYDFPQRNFPQIRMRGINQNLSIYDLFVFWHVLAMMVETPLGSGRKAAHSGPVFLPWHRHYMILLEQFMQSALGDDDFGLPYWDWAADGELPRTQQWQTQLWTANYIGEARNRVLSGPIGGMRVRLWQDRSGVLHSIEPRPIERNTGRGVGARDLPTTASVTTAKDENFYDLSPWSGGSQGGHRNRLEGWIGGPRLHNRVHVWIGEDMSPGTSPNDPVFFLNHCNVDRIWESWMVENSRSYEPQAPIGPVGHRLNDTLLTILGGARVPADVLDPGQWYSYGSLTVD